MSSVIVVATTDDVDRNEAGNPATLQTLTAIETIDEVSEPEFATKLEGTGRFIAGGQNGKWRCLLI